MSLLIGLAAGLFGGLVGLGGGVVMIPLMVRVEKLSQHRAHGTSLVALVFTGMAGAATYALGGLVDYSAAGILAVSAAITAGMGAKAAQGLAEWKLKKSFGFFLIFISLLLISKPYLPRLVIADHGVARALVLLFFGSLTGFLSGMMGVGGGSIMVPVMVLLLGMDQHTAQGSSLLAMVLGGAVGAWTHRKLGNVAQNLLLGLIPGVLLGTLVGAKCAHLLPEHVLRVIFAVVISWTGLRYARISKPAAAAPKLGAA